MSDEAARTMIDNQIMRRALKYIAAGMDETQPVAIGKLAPTYARNILSKLTGAENKYECKNCFGLGRLHSPNRNGDPMDEGVSCPVCEGSGWEPEATPCPRHH